jgi:hypothetical protein
MLMLPDGIDLSLDGLDELFDLDPEFAKLSAPTPAAAIAHQHLQAFVPHNFTIESSGGADGGGGGGAGGGAEGNGSAFGSPTDESVHKFQGPIPDSFYDLTEEQGGCYFFLLFFVSACTKRMLPWSAQSVLCCVESQNHLPFIFLPPTGYFRTAQPSHFLQIWLADLISPPFRCVC